MINVCVYDLETVQLTSTVVQTNSALLGGHFIKVSFKAIESYCIISPFYKSSTFYLNSPKSRGPWQSFCFRAEGLSGLNNILGGYMFNEVNL